MALRNIFWSSKKKQNGNADGWGFDPAYYAKNNPDVVSGGGDLRKHYMEHGWRELRDPSDYFSTAGYLNANPDVAAAEINPLLHYLRSGIAEGRHGWQKRRAEDWSAQTAAELQLLQKQVTEMRQQIGPQVNNETNLATQNARILAHMTPRAAMIWNQFSKISPNTVLD